MTLKDHLKTLMPKALSSEVKALRDEGNRLRDEGKFAEAAEFYQKYLAAKPNDFSIWVQRGNCLKDTESFDAAKVAYDEAAKLNSDDADLNLQLGHLMKLQGRRGLALKYYRRSYDLNPNLSGARNELRMMGVKLKESASPLEGPNFQHKSANILDISDLLIFLAVHSRVTGIQRVQSCIVQEILASKAIHIESTSNDTIFCYCDQEQQIFYAVSSADVKTLIDTVNSSIASRRDIDHALSDIYGNRVKILPRAGDIYCILGAFWVGNDYSGCLWQLKNRQVAIGVYIYDLIPLTHPQFVTESTRQAVVDKFGDVMSLVDFALTISEYVAKEVTQTLETALNRRIPVLAVPLAHALPENEEEASEDVDDEFKDSLPAEYVLCVCTLEGRKNHLILLQSWIALNQRHNGRIPTLVLVGKWGWRIEEFQALMNSSKSAAGKVVILGNLSDCELKHLYQNCLFTVFPSFVEGWGLPVGESLAYAKPCIASNASSIPEVGGEFCRYINPYDFVGTLDTIEKAIFDRKGLEEWTERVARNFKVRTWSDVAETFLRRLSEAASSVPKERTSAIVLAPGRVYWLNRLAIYGGASTSWQNRAIKFVCSAGWRPFEDWGAWSSRRTADIVFGTKAPPLSRFRVLLQLRLPPPREIDNLRCLDMFGGTTLVQFDSGGPKWVSIDTQSDDDRQVRITLERIGTIEQVDSNRPLFHGVSAVAYHQRDDIAGRLDVLESIAFLSG